MSEKPQIALTLFILYLLFTMLYGIETQNITQSQPLLQGQTLSSPGHAFELGFFSRNNSSNYYLGIWYANIVPQTVVWVANKERPVTNCPASLKIDSNGNVILVDEQNKSYWSTNTSVAPSDLVAELSDEGFLFLKDRRNGTYIWESTSNLCDTFLPAVTSLWVEVTTGDSNGLISWQSDNDPSSGNFFVGLASQKLPHILIWNGPKPYWRSGQWNTSKFIGAPYFATSNVVGSLDSVAFDVVTYYFNGDSTADEYIFHLASFNSSILSHFVISSRGSLKLMHWVKDKGWYTSWEAPNSQCEIYGACGPNGVCQKSDPLTCQCLKGFIPLSDEEWSKGNWTRGCKRQVKLLCQSNLRFLKGKADEFLKMSGLKLPDFADSFNIEDSNLCHQLCIRNCSCNAYAFVSGIGCMAWTGDLVDVQELSEAGEDLFLRVAHLELAEEKLLQVLIISFSATLIATIVGVIAFGLRRRRANQIVKRKADNFSEANKLGQGGFGSVYKGTLLDGREVAIKRLSSSSGQGTEEFKNETMLISKLQHRNLVTLIGYCIAREEKILIYEYMSNKSLDAFLFDPIKKRELDWVKRFNIIQGVAQGLLYLHRDSRLRIIHRDLKVSNVLLDEMMNPKISDFGLARIFQETQDLANTRRVVGTLGYMSPEYALGGIFSKKSDVFGFGVLVLEIVSGKRNCFQDDYQHFSLISHAWKLWSENKGSDLMDEVLAYSFKPSEVMKCIEIALLCVQDQAADRPNMAAVISMLSSKEMFGKPKEPTLLFQLSMKSSFGKESSGYKGSAYEVTLSPIVGR